MGARARAQGPPQGHSETFGSTLAGRRVLGLPSDEAHGSRSPHGAAAPGCPSTNTARSCLPGPCIVARMGVRRRKALGHPLLAPRPRGWLALPGESLGTPWSCPQAKKSKWRPGDGTSRPSREDFLLGPQGKTGLPVSTGQPGLGGQAALGCCWPNSQVTAPQCPALGVGPGVLITSGGFWDHFVPLGVQGAAVPCLLGLGTRPPVQ